MMLFGYPQWFSLVYWHEMCYSRSDFLKSNILLIHLIKSLLGKVGGNCCHGLPGYKFIFFREFIDEI